MSDFSRAEREYERRQEARYEAETLVERQLDDYKEENFGRALIEYIGTEQPATELTSILTEADDESLEAKKIIQYVKAYSTKGKLNKPELAELGSAFMDLIYKCAQPYIDDELEKEFYNE